MTMATAPIHDPAFRELEHARAEMMRAREAILVRLNDGPQPAGLIIRDVAGQVHVDRAVVQKALISALRVGRVRMDRLFRLTLG